jgi:hypothetical protein
MRVEVVVPGRVVLGAGLRGDDDEAIAVGRVQQRRRALLARARAAGVEQQDRLAHRHLDAAPRQRDQTAIDRREHRDEQPSAEPRLRRRLERLVDP